MYNPAPRPPACRSGRRASNPAARSALCALFTVAILLTAKQSSTRAGDRAPAAPRPVARPVDRPLPPPVIRQVSGPVPTERPVLELQVTPPPQLSQSAPETPPAVPPAVPPAEFAPPAPGNSFNLEQLNAGGDVRPLSDSTIDLRPTTAAPDSPAASVFVSSVDVRSAYGWMAPMGSPHTACVSYNPLYFEEINLERYGYHCGCLQPIVSAVQFYGTLPLLPYKMAHRPPCSCEVNLQYPPAATCAPPVRCCRRPIDPKAVAVEAAIIAGAILLFP